MNIFKILTFQLVLFSIPSGATDFSYLYSTSSLSQKSYLDYTWMQKGNFEKNNLTSVTLGYGTGYVNLYDANNNVIAVDFNEFSGSLGLSTPSQWTWVFGVIDHRDVQDDTQMISSYIQFSKKIKTDDKNSDIFVPSFKYKLRLSLGQYSHKPMGQTDPIVFDQNSAKLSLNYEPNSIYDFGISYKKYQYSADPANFVMNTNNLNFGNTTSIFAYSISLVPDSILSLMVNLHIRPKLSLEFSLSETKDAADTGTGTDLSALVSYDFGEKWSCNFGVDQSKFTTNSTSSTYALLGLDYYY